VRFKPLSHLSSQQATLKKRLMVRNNFPCATSSELR
jgi:hypothetical protein